jgi:ubiquinone/menaquinone biosynthesis C-methylase UbiE
MNIYDFWQKYISKSYFVLKKILSKHINVKKTDKILDYGCGTGKYCTFFNPKNYLGLDINKKSINIAKKKYKQYHFKELSKKLNVKDNSFDFILILGVFHHISNNEIKPILKEINRVLKKNGKILIIEPILSETSTRINKWMQFVDRGKHFRYEKELIQLISKYFKVRFIEQFITDLFYNEFVFELKKIKKN